MDRSTTARTLETLARVSRERRTLAEDDGSLSDFTPHCLDCGYDLSTLLDGRCPECGLGFSHVHLREVERDRRARARNLISKFRHAPLLIGIFPFVLGGALEGYPGFAVQMFSLLLAGGLWGYLNRTWFSYRSHYLLVLLAPLAYAFLLIASAPSGVYGMIACVALAAVIAFLALRSSPLVSSAVLTAGVLAPMVIGGIALVLENRRLKAAGVWWGSLDIPAIPHWRPVNPPQAIQAGVWLLVLAGIFALGIGLVARRSLRRIRRARAPRNL